MAELGRGDVRIRAVTIRKKGDEEEGSSVGEDVVSVRPSFTAGFVDLYSFVKFLSIIGDCQQARTGGRDDHLLDQSFFQSYHAILTSKGGRPGPPNCASCWRVKETTR